MRILYNAGDIFDLPKSRNEAVCITTNGIVKKNGCAVMGAGIAKQANMSFNGLALNLGGLLSQYGNRVYDMGFYEDSITGKWVRIITFPTKHHWKNNSDLKLIKASAEQLIDICDGRGITTCYLTRPGCALGGLDWEGQVKPLLESILDDRFVIADYQLKEKRPWN